MRPLGQLRGGFFPAPGEAIALAAKYLQPPRNERFTVLDPCAGEGTAIIQLADLLACPLEAIHAIELDDSRAEKLRATLPQAHVLAPASFFGCRSSFNSFSLIWLNPPFDHSYSGNRVEDRFLLQATDWLMPGGVMALVCPEDVASEGGEVRKHLIAYFEKCMIVPFPENQRRFKEVIVFGKKMSKPRARNGLRSWQSIQASRDFIYEIPASTGPRIFKKVEPTEPELRLMLANSSLRAHLATPRTIGMPSPPLALGVGHVALLLASGQLDGTIHPQGQSPHVVRGTSRKKEFIANVTETENADGSTTTKTTISEKIELIVRTVDLTGKILTFMDADTPELRPSFMPKTKERHDEARPGAIAS